MSRHRINSREIYHIDGCSGEHSFGSRSLRKAHSSIATLEDGEDKNSISSGVAKVRWMFFLLGAKGKGQMKRVSGR